MSAPIQRAARALLLSGALAAPGLGLAQAPGGGPAAPTPVTVVTLSAQEVTLTAELPGRVVASGVAEVRPQVNGIIEARLYEEGSDVAVGQPLYRIDRASYEAKVAAARAQVAQAEAQLKAARREAERLAELIARKVASEQTFDAAVAARDGAAAALQGARADLQSAEIDLDRTTIRAPLAGVIGRSLTTQGALVTNGQAEPLSVIRAIDPVLVDVTQSAAEILAWRRGLMAERLAGAETAVTLTLADGATYEHAGSLRAAEPYVNEQTGVVTLRMEFPNPDRLLLPGMYVQVAMPQGVVEDVVLAPHEAVAYDRRGRPTALVVGPDDVVALRELEIVAAQDAAWIVRSGLADGDRLIVEGLQKVRPGATVAPEERAAPASANTPATGSVADARP